MKEVENILRILKESRRAIGEDDIVKLKSLSNQMIHSAALYQDGDNIVVAVLVYSLGKVLERNYYRFMDGWGVFYKDVVKNLDLAIGELEKNNVKSVRIYLGRIRNSLNKIDGDLGNYIKDVFKKAEINKAFKLYEHGLSMEKTAKLLGVSLWDVASYIGQSSISEAKVGITMLVKDRVKIAEGMFDGK